MFQIFISLQRVAELKGTKQTATGSAAGTSSHPVKRKTVETENTDLKRVKGNEREMLARICPFYILNVFGLFCSCGSECEYTRLFSSCQPIAAEKGKSLLFLFWVIGLN